MHTILVVWMIVWLILIIPMIIYMIMKFIIQKTLNYNTKESLKTFGMLHYGLGNGVECHVYFLGIIPVIL